MKNFLWDVILSLFGKKQKRTEETKNNKKYSNEYENDKDINVTSIFSNKLANYTINDSTIDIDGNDKRSEILKDALKRLKKQLKKHVSRQLGTGGILIIPYVANNKMYFNIITQDRFSINQSHNEDIFDCTIVADIKKMNNSVYCRYADYTLKDNNLSIKYRATKDNSPIALESVEEWKNIKDTNITNVIKMPFAYIKCPTDNRKEDSNYGVPITYGCDKQITEIKVTLEQILREYQLKEAFVGADSTMFKGDDALPSNGLYKKINSGEDNFWEVFDPAIRDSSLFNKLMNQCAMLEKQVGTSRGILTDPLSTYQNTQETRRALYDTFSIVDDIRASWEQGIEDFLYACDVLANYYNLSPMGKYNLITDWSYSYIEDENQIWNQMVQGKNQGVIKKVELRQYLRPDETLEEAQKAIEEIEASEPTTKDLLGE
jgi:A118 family predicted phage portal protein